MSFSIDKEYLVSITSKYETRSFAEDVDALEERGDDLNWMIEALQTDKTKGISSKEEDLVLRKEAFGSNEKYAKEPPGFCELFCAALEDFTLRILIVASIVSIAIEVGTADNEKRKIAWI